MYGNHKFVNKTNNKGYYGCPCNLKMKEVILLVVREPQFHKQTNLILALDLVTILASFLRFLEFFHTIFMT